MMTSNSEHAQK